MAQQGEFVISLRGLEKIMAGKRIGSFRSLVPQGKVRMAFLSNLWRNHPFNISRIASCVARMGAMACITKEQQSAFSNSFMHFVRMLCTFTIFMGIISTLNYFFLFE